MSIICWIRRHDWIAVREDGVALFRPDLPFPMPSMRYRVDPEGRHRACKRCGHVDPSPTTPTHQPTEETKA